MRTRDGGPASRLNALNDCLACFWDRYRREHPRATMHQLDPSEHPETWEVREHGQVVYGPRQGNPRVCLCAIRDKYVGR